MWSRSRSLRLALVGLSSGAALLAACQKAAPPQEAYGPSQVTVVTLKAESVLLTRELPGRTSAFLVAEVRPQVNGLVLRRLFTEGGVVKQGQPLYELDDATYRADYGSAKAALDRAQATLTSAALTARRSAELLKLEAVTPADNEKAVAALGQAEADVKAAQAALQRANVTLGYARITSPISGRIGKSSVTQGALVTANQPTALAVVQQLDPLYVDLTQSSSELLRLRKELSAGTLKNTDSTPVTLLLEDGSRYEHPGSLTFSDVTVDPGTGSFALRVTVPNPDQSLLPGMYVRALVGNGLRQQGILVPQQGIARDAKGNASALVVGKDGKVEPRVVQASRTVGDRWLVDSGLVEGDRVIVEGLQKIQPGMPVQATEAPPAVAKPGEADPLVPAKTQE